MRTRSVKNDLTWAVLKFVNRVLYKLEINWHCREALRRGLSVKLALVSDRILGLVEEVSISFLVLCVIATELSNEIQMTMPH